MRRLTLFTCCLLLAGPASAQHASRLERNMASCWQATATVIAAQPDPVLAACAHVIISGVATSRGTAMAFVQRGIAWEDKRDYERAIGDYTEALELTPRNVVAYYDRGNAHKRADQFPQAIADYSAALRLDPKFVKAYVNRGGARLSEGKFEQANADFRRAIALDPRPVAAYRGLGWDEFLQGRDALAEKDIEHAWQLHRDRYEALWLYLTGEREGHDARARLAAAAKAFSGQTWPQPIVDYYLGRLDEDGLVAAAATPGSETVSEQMCEVDFYVAEAQLLRLEPSRARWRFERARASCPKGYYEYAGAVVELKRLGE